MFIPQIYSPEGCWQHAALSLKAFDLSVDVGQEFGVQTRLPRQSSWKLQSPSSIKHGSSLEQHPLLYPSYLFQVFGLHLGFPLGLQLIRGSSSFVASYIEIMLYVMKLDWRKPYIIYYMYMRHPDLKIEYLGCSIWFEL